MKTIDWLVGIRTLQIPDSAAVMETGKPSKEREAVGSPGKAKA